MSHKSVLQQIAAMQVDHTTNTREVLTRVIGMAKVALEDNGKGEATKQAKDRKRADAAILTLENVVLNPTRLLCSSMTGDSLPASFMPAVESELARMRGAVGNPDALRMIYRRNEGRRG